MGSLVQLKTQTSLSISEQIQRKLHGVKNWFLCDCSGSMGTVYNGMTLISSAISVLDKVGARNIIGFGWNAKLINIEDVRRDPHSVFYTVITSGTSYDSAISLLMQVAPDATGAIMLTDGMPSNKDLSESILKQSKLRIEGIYIGDPSLEGSKYLDYFCSLSGGSSQTVDPSKPDFDGLLEDKITKYLNG